FAKSQAAVDVESAKIGHGVDAGRFGRDIGDGDFTGPQKGIITQVRVHIAHALDNRKHLVDSIIAQMIGGGVSTAPPSYHLHFDTSLVSSIHLHFGRFANYHKIGTDTFVFYQRMTGDPVAPFFHIAEVVGRPTL